MSTPTETADDLRALTPEALGELWEMSAASIRELCRRGDIPAKKLGPKCWRIPVAALKAWALDGKGKPESVSTARPASPPYRIVARRHA